LSSYIFPLFVHVNTDAKAQIFLSLRLPKSKRNYDSLKLITAWKSEKKFCISEEK